MRKKKNQLNNQKTMIMASGPITSWQINGETMETVKDFIFLWSKITADGDCSHEIKRFLLLGRKVMTNLDSILKNRDITLPTKVHLVKPMVFPIVMYGCESWIIKKAEHWRTEAFEVCCWRRLESPLDCKEIQPVNPKGNQFWIFIGRTDFKAETPILWPPDVKNWLTEKTLMLGKIEGGRGDDRGWDGWMASPTQWTWVWVSSRSWWWTGNPGVLQSMGHKELHMTEPLNWTDKRKNKSFGFWKILNWTNNCSK